MEDSISAGTSVSLIRAKRAFNSRGLSLKMALHGKPMYDSYRTYRSVQPTLPNPATPPWTKHLKALLSGKRHDSFCIYCYR